MTIKLLLAIAVTVGMTSLMTPAPLVAESGIRSLQTLSHIQAADANQDKNAQKSVNQPQNTTTNQTQGSQQQRARGSGRR